MAVSPQPVVAHLGADEEIEVDAFLVAVGYDTGDKLVQPLRKVVTVVGYFLGDQSSSTNTGNATSKFL